MEEQKELRLSVSKTKTYIQCKKQYDYTYNIKLPRKEFSFHTLGKFCHKVLEDYHLEYINGSTEPHNKVMTKAWKSAWLEFKEKMTPDMKKECWDMVNQYLKIVSTSPNANVLSCEKSFAMDIGEQVVLNGFIDRIQLDPDNVLHVADYKTTKNEKYLKNDWFQLLTYCYV